MLLIYHTNTALQNCAICYILLACIVSQPSTGRAPQHWTRERLDTLRQHRSGRSASRRSGDRRRETRRQHQRQSRPEIKPRSGTPEEPEPARQRRRRQDRQQTPSPTRAAEIEPEPESQKRGTVDHGRRRTETERRRAEKERERRENDSKTPLFSPSHRTPADQPPEPAPHRQTWTAAKTPPFSVLLLWSMRNQRRSTPVLTIRKAGTVHIFTTSPTPKIWLCTLFSTPLSFSPSHHLTNTPFINDIFPYKYKYPMLQSSLRKNALINAGSSSELHTKTPFHNFLLRNMP